MLPIGLLLQTLVDRADGGGSGIGALDEELLGAGVRVVEEQFADGGFTIATGTAGLLVVGFNATRNFVVDDKAHIGAVDAHAERVGGHGDVRFSADEGFLRLVALAIAHAAMVGDALHAPMGQRF